MRRAKLTVHSADFILKEGIIPVLVAEPYSPAFKAVIERLTADPMLQVVEVGSYNDAVGVARKVGQCLILFHCPNSKDVTEQLHFLKSLSKEIQSKNVRAVLTISVYGQAPIDSKLEVYGVSEIVREPVTEKSLVFKLEKHIRNLMHSQKTNIRAAQAIGSNSETVNFADNPELSTAALETIRLDSELKLESDFWLLAGGGAKIVGGRWTVRLVGPGPLAGHFFKSDYSDGTGDSNYWEWKSAQAENDPFIKNGGTWIFKGQRPEFQMGYWNFVSKSPELFFYKDNEKKGSKVRTDENDILCVAKDSSVSREFIALIKNSTNRKLSSKTDDKKVKVVAAARPRDSLIKGPLDDDVMNPAKPTVEAPPFRLVQPLNTKSDCWLLQKRRPRWIGGRWVVKMLGPGASTGNWIPYTMAGNYTDMLKGGDEKFWQWVPTSDKDNFIADPGSWIFFGLVPKIEDDCWLFVGKNLSLTFWHDQVNKGERIKVDSNGTLLVAWDSEHAKELLPKLEKSQAEMIRLEKKESKLIIAAAAPKAAVAEPKMEIKAAEPVVAKEAKEEPEVIVAEYKEEAKSVEEAEPIFAAQAMPEIPLGLQISPMAFALIVSELAATQKNTRAVVGRKVSGYLSSTCNGSRVEIWKKDKEAHWVCVATNDGTSGKFEDELNKSDLRTASEVNGKGVAPIYSDLHQPEKIVGAVVVDGMQKNKISLSFLQAVAQATCTVIK